MLNVLVMHLIVLTVCLQVRETMTGAQMAVSFPIAMILLCLSLVGTGLGLRSLTPSEDDTDKQSDRNIEHSPLTP